MSISPGNWSHPLQSCATHRPGLLTSLPKYRIVLSTPICSPWPAMSLSLRHCWPIVVAVDSSHSLHFDCDSTHIHCQAPPHRVFHSVLTWRLTIPLDDFHCFVLMAYKTFQYCSSQGPLPHLCAMVWNVHWLYVQLRVLCRQGLCLHVCLGFCHPEWGQHLVWAVYAFVELTQLCPRSKCQLVRKPNYITLCLISQILAW